MNAYNFLTGAVLIGSPRCNLFQGHQVVDQVDNAAMKIVGTDHRPEPAKMAYRVAQKYHLLRNDSAVSIGCVKKSWKFIRM